MKTKTIPFDLETAKKIQAGEIEGKIKTRDGYDVRVIYWDKKSKDIEIVALVTIVDIEECHIYQIDGKMWKDKTSTHDLVLEVPYNEPYFKPFDKVLVRRKDETNNKWFPAIYAYYNNIVSHITIDHKMYEDCIPYEGNEHLVGTTDKPKEEQE